MKNYVEENDLNVDELECDNIDQKFQFGPSKVYESTKRLHLPIMSRDRKGRAIKMIVRTCLVDADVPLLIGKNILMEWGASTNHKENILWCDSIMENETIEFELDQTTGGHDALKLENLKEETLKNTVSYINEQISKEDPSNVFDFKKVKHVHELTNHKQEENMLYAYRNAGILTEGGRKVIKRVINSCKVCKKF